MSIHALLGLGLLNAFLLAVGSVVLWALRGVESGWELLSTSGVGYMLGVALVGVALTIELAVGLSFSLASILITGVVLAAVAIAGRPLLRGSRHERRNAPVRGVGVVGAVYVVLVGLYLEALFRAARLMSLTTFDAWAFWVPKAQAIYYFGGLDERFFRELSAPSYPPLVPALEASAFLFMGSADVVTLHVQFWFLACGFVAALAGLLGPRVHPAFLGPCLLLALVAPRFVGRTLDPQADFLVDYFFALAALLVALWLVHRQPWLLATAACFMAGAALTKREGQLFVACVVLAGILASWRSWRYAWPRLALAAVVPVVASIPWKLWFSSRHLAGELPASGTFAFLRHLDRGWPALHSTALALFDYHLWLVALPAIAVAIALAYAAGARVLPTYTLALFVLVCAGLTWVLWSFTELELPLTQDESISPIVRLSASLVVTSAALLPVLLDSAWRGGDGIVENRCE